MIPWNPTLIAQAESLEWQSRVVVDGFLQGPHRSTQRGFSAEFAQNRPYLQGDDPRHLDWRAYARFDRLYIRESDAETNLRLQVVVDGSASMDWRGERAPWRKYDSAALLAACLLRLARRSGDAVGLTILNQGIAEHLPARLDPGQFRRALGALERHRPGGVGELGRGLHQVAELIPARGAVVVISDGWDEVDPLLTGLKRLDYAHHDLAFLQIVDPQELRFDFARSQLFEDPETGVRLPVTPAWSRKTYLDRIALHQQQLHDGLRGIGAQHALLPSDEPPFHALAQVLARRNGRR